MILTCGALKTELLFVRTRPRLALGMGEVARERLVRFLSAHRPAGVLVVGFCGATRASLPPGALILAEAAAAGEEIPLPQELLARAKAALPEAEVGPVATVASPAAPAEKARLSVDALAVDMESGHLAAELSSRGIPFLVVRCVLDALWEDVTCGLKLRFARRALACARRLGQAAGALVPVLEGAT